MPHARTIILDTGGAVRHPAAMDWALAIHRNREALLAVVGAIRALLGGSGAGEGPVARSLRNAALALLKPAESALRRLIVIAARGLVPPAGAHRLLPAGVFGQGAAGLARPPAFRLLDALKPLHPLAPVAPRVVPRIRTFWASAMLAPPAQLIVPAASGPGVSRSAAADPDALVDVARLRLRLAAMERALADLPRQARRYARWRARTAASARPRWALRPGRPPGYRRRPGREVDLVLKECHALALDVFAADTS
jgi:hypothetical protein